MVANSNAKFLVYTKKLITNTMNPIMGNVNAPIEIGMSQGCFARSFSVGSNN